MTAAGGYTVALTVGFVLSVFFIVKPVVHYFYHHFRLKGDVADSSLFSALLILMLLVLAFTAQVIGVHSTAELVRLTACRHPRVLRVLFGGPHCAQGRHAAAAAGAQS